MPTIIAVDAMGSDRAPKPEVEGAILAARHYDVEVVLVGKEEVVRAELEAHRFWRRCPSPSSTRAKSSACRRKLRRPCAASATLRCASAFAWCAMAAAAGFVTAGNTGAAMATAKMVLGAIPGVDRPALAAVFPTAQGTATILIDVGANVDSKPQNLQQFAIMGDVYFHSIFAGRFRGSETDGSIVSPSMRCGVTGLRPTYGRAARTGAMTRAGRSTSWVPWPAVSKTQCWC